MEVRAAAEGGGGTARGHDLTCAGCQRVPGALGGCEHTSMQCSVLSALDKAASFRRTRASLLPPILPAAAICTVARLDRPQGKAQLGGPAEMAECAGNCKEARRLWARS